MVYGIYRIYIYIYYVSANKMTKRRLLAAKRMFKKKRRKIQIDTYITYSTAKQINILLAKNVCRKIMVFQHLMKKKRKKHGSSIMKCY